MASFNIFKKKKEPKKKAVAVKSEIKEAKAAPTKEVATQKKAGIIYGVVKVPHISEKSTNLGKINQYTFKVFPGVNKQQTKKAIEKIYGVKVLSVNMITISPKKRRLGGVMGLKSGYRKAIVKIQEGQTIEIM
ncbi:MAG: 50S ribosomal protein L23 [Candidatus Staskawiczbacteria bacterium]|jgi:large subunit ribosomal protein L23